jgi:type IV pilus assembly protein PilB
LQDVVDALEGLVAQKRLRDSRAETSGIGGRLARRPLGNLLVARGYILDVDLQRALWFQAQSPGKRLGEVLVDMRLITEREIAEILAEQMRLPFMPLARVRCHPDIVAMISCHDARRLGATPVRRTPAGLIAVAVADPTDELAIDTLSQLLREPLEIHVAARSEILAVVEAREDATFWSSEKK